MGPGSPLLPCAGGESCRPQLRVLLRPQASQYSGCPALILHMFSSEKPGDTAQQGLRKSYGTFVLTPRDPVHLTWTHHQVRVPGGA